MRYQVDCGLVQKRAKSISSVYDKADCKMFLERAIKSEENKSSTKKNDILRFFSECCTVYNANKYFSDCIGFISDENSLDPKFADILTEKFVNNIMPYITCTDYVKKVSDRYPLNESQRSIIESTAGAYKICDRVLDNHEKISTRFDLDSYVESGRHKDLDRVVLKCCSMLDTYDLKPHAKMNVCLEELSYLLQKHNVKYDKSKFVKYVTEYFLTRQKEVSDGDFIRFRTVLSENSMISDNDLSAVTYFTELYDDSKSIMLQLLNNFTKSEKKDILNDFGAIIRSAPVGYMIPRNDFCTNFGLVLSYIRDYLLIDAYDITEIIEVLSTVADNIEEQMSNDTWKYSREELDQIVSQFEKEINIIDLELNSCTEQDLVEKLVALKDCYNEIIRRINVIRGFIYTTYNIECMNSISTMVESNHAIYLSEFKIFKFQNLITAAIEADKFLKGKGKKLMDKISGKLRRIRKKNIHETSIYQIISEDNTADICIMSFAIIDESNFVEVQDTLTELCKSFNDTYLANKDYKMYYKVLTDAVELHLEDSTYIILSDIEESIVAKTMSYENQCRVLEIEEMANFYESVDYEGLSHISDRIKESVSTLNAEQFSVVIEASKFIESVSKDDIDKAYSLFTEYSLNESYSALSTAKNSVLQWNHEDAPMEIQIEAYNIISAILEDKNENSGKTENKDRKGIVDKIKSKIPSKDNKDKDDKKEKVKQDKPDESGKKDPRNPFSGVNLTSLKLYAKGLKAKMKDMSNKEKEWSKNVDMEFNRLYRGCKEALTNDRREGIIKGSIIPSFSKCIKLGIAVAGISFINPVAGAAAVVGGVALSKNLNKKERLLLLDEIETELEVVEKEIQIAESKNQMKKYRKLLQYKKDLQRQYQRIRYNVRIGKDLLPDSTTGMKSND